VGSPETLPGRQATRADVARRAGVSTAVVSYVVNGGPRTVATETAARVRAAVEDLHYRPNANARALRKGRTEMLGLVLPDIGNPFFAEYALAIELAAAAHGNMLVVGDLAGRHVDGLLLCTVSPPGAVSKLALADRPTDFIDSANPVPGHHALGPDSEQGSARAVEHLITVHALSSIVLIIGLARDVLPEPRERGWTSAFRAHGLAPGPVVRTTFSREGGYAAMTEVLGWRTRPRAVFVASDQQATGVLRAIRQAGVRCPDEIAVVSFDGTTESEYCSPPLTAVRQPIAAMADAAVTALLGATPPPSFARFATELVVRESCGCSKQPPCEVSVQHEGVS